MVLAHGAFRPQNSLAMVFRIGTLAAINCLPRQAWKGAAEAVDSGAEMLLVRNATLFLFAYYTNLNELQGTCAQMAAAALSRHDWPGAGFACARQRS